MNIERSSGALLHPTSLPGPYGIGDLGPEAYSFVDWLAMAGFGYWQVLPLGPTGFGNSPYQCHSVFAGNPNLISPQLLLRDGLILESEIKVPSPDPIPGRVDFRTLIPWKSDLVRSASLHFEQRASPALRQEFAGFIRSNSNWLPNFGLFMALKGRNLGASVLEWPEGERSPEGAGELRVQLEDQVLQCAFGQWLFFHQWGRLRHYAQNRGVGLIGDAPIFAALDSADVWSNPELFCLDASGAPTSVAGVPPDYFAPTGQLWGNPLYDWKQHKRSEYRWWIQRVRSLLGLVNLVRLDHFRGFGGYWEIPRSAPTAESGKWQPGPAEDFLDALVRAVDRTPEHPDLPLIAEDLGVATPDVAGLLKTYDLPGMRVLQFGFTGFQDDFLPQNYPVNCVAYTGTHDNDTSRGWFSAAPQQERQNAIRYLQSSESTIVQDMMNSVWGSQAVLTIAPVQDILDLGSEARMNFPGKAQGYWEWRMPPHSLAPSIALELRSLNERSDRLVAA
jgi:4-alpha-glucanotransferase